MQKTKTYVLILFLAIFSLIFASVAFAYNGDYYYLNLPSNSQAAMSSSITQTAETFQVVNGSVNLQNVTIWVENSPGGGQNPVYNLTCSVYQTSGVYGLDVPNSLVETSGSQLSSSSVPSNAFQNYTFPFSGNTVLFQGNSYAVVVAYLNGSFPNGAQIYLEMQISPSYSGNFLQMVSGIWNSYANYAIDFSVNGDLWMPALPSPTPNVTPSPSDYVPPYDVSTGGFMLWLTALSVMIIPTGLLWWVFGKNKFGAFLGLAIGTGLGYMIPPMGSIVPLWLVILVAFGEIGFLLMPNVTVGRKGGD